MSKDILKPLKNNKLASVLIVVVLIFAFMISTTRIINDDPNKNYEHIDVILSSDLSHGTVPLEIHFKTLLTKEGDFQYEWDFGDGETSNKKTPTHSYEKEGEYICSVKIMNKDGASGHDSVPINVMKNNPPFVKIITDKNSGYRPVEINFDADCFDIDGEIISYEWEIKYPPFFSHQKIVNHSEKKFTERFIRPGFYEVKLTVSDDYGNEKIDYEKIQIHGSKIEQAFFSSLTICNMLNGFLIFINKIRDVLQGHSPSNIFN